MPACNIAFVARLREDFGLLADVASACELSLRANIEEIKSNSNNTDDSYESEADLLMDPFAMILQLINLVLATHPQDYLDPSVRSKLYSMLRPSLLVNVLPRLVFWYISPLKAFLFFH